MKLDSHYLIGLGEGIRLLSLEEIGHHIKMFAKGLPQTRGRKLTGWEPLDLNDPNQLALAILKAIKE